MLIVIPAHNEEATIEDVVLDLKSHGYNEILIVDDASTDATASIARSLGVKVMPLPYNIGAWKATQAGVRYANNRGFTHLVTFDADRQHLASQIGVLVDKQRSSSANLVIGSCPSRGSLARKVAWSLFRTLAGVKVEDLTSGFRLYDRRAIEVLSKEEASLLEYQDVGVLLLLKTFDISKAEVHVKMEKRQSGISRIFYSWWAVTYYMGYTTMLCLSKIAKKTHLIPTQVKDS
ncbi:glycosyltransferase family 2 protein [Pseudoalteromonas spongiae]|uniref:Glycosyltransferase family 2 protein n=1 Tax=Pseudoalteromonas spongiae TaxID=298657 RepID=A0ABU8ENX7_9GAMM